MLRGVSDVRGLSVMVRLYNGGLKVGKLVMLLVWLTVLFDEHNELISVGFIRLCCKRTSFRLIKGHLSISPLYLNGD